MTWKDAEDIALALMEKHPGVDPLTVRFTDLHKWVVGAPGIWRRSEGLERKHPRDDPDEVARGVPGSVTGSARLTS
jgi:hypothetical protein